MEISHDACQQKDRCQILECTSICLSARCVTSRTDAIGSLTLCCRIQPRTTCIKWILCSGKMSFTYSHCCHFTVAENRLMECSSGNSVWFTYHAPSLAVYFSRVTSIVKQDKSAPLPYWSVPEKYYVAGLFPDAGWLMRAPAVPVNEDVIWIRIRDSHRACIKFLSPAKPSWKMNGQEAGHNSFTVFLIPEEIIAHLYQPEWLCLLYW